MGISSILSFIGMLGFLLFIAGIALVVYASTQGRAVQRGIVLSIVGLVVGLIFTVISQGILIVQPNQIAVIFNTLNGNLETPRTAGTHIVIPVVQEVTLYQISQHQYTLSDIAGEGTSSGDVGASARTVDGQEVSIDVTAIYAINPAEVNTIHQRWQHRYIDEFIRPTLRSYVRDIGSQFTAAEIYGERRGEMEAAIQDALAVRMSEEGLILVDLLVRDINFSAVFTAAIEQAQIAAQEAEQARLRVQQIQQEAEQARAQAIGQRDAAIARAEGEAQSIILRAQAEAEALRLVSEQIAANPSLIQYQYIQNLSDQVSLMLVPTNSPFLFDMASLAEANPDFSAPEVPTIRLPEVEIVPETDLQGSGKN